MANPQAIEIRLRLAEGRVKRALDVAESAQTDPAKERLFLATARDLPCVKKNFEEDYLTLASTSGNRKFDAAAHDARLASFEGSYYAVMAAVDSFTVGEHKAEDPTTANSSGSSQIALPKLQLPCFDGNVREWVNFSNLFTTLVAENSNLKAIEKLVFLKTSLSGEALSMVQALPLSDANFAVAWELLSNRYQNKRLVVALHVDALLQAPSAGANSPASLRRLITLVTENVSALKALQVPIDQWDLILLPILLRRLDKTLQVQWELTLKDDELPTVTNFIKFLEKQCRSQEAVNSSELSLHASQGMFVTRKPRESNQSGRSPRNFMVNPSADTCVVCGRTHSLLKCPEFGKKNPKERYNIVKEKKLCLNCFQASHQSRRCRSKIHCNKCGARHHSLLHFPLEGNDGKETDSLSTPTESAANEREPVNVLSSFFKDSRTILLSTAIIDVLDSSGAFQSVRVLLDSGSQANFVTDSCLMRLGLSRKKMSLPLQGLSQAPLSVAKGTSCCVLKPSGREEPMFATELLVLPRITGAVPVMPLQEHIGNHVSGLRLADPTYATPGQIDMLLGAELFPHLLTGQKTVGPPGSPVALETVFGWILMGPVQHVPSPSTESVCPPLASLFISRTASETLEGVMERLWKLEELPENNPSVNPEDKICDTLFSKGHVRTPVGRYSVPLPFKVPNPELGDSSGAALRRFCALEHRLERDPEVKASYTAFMQEYISEGHMSCVDPTTLPEGRTYFIPHHCVMKTESTTTKLRVVFDASAKTTSGISLNDMLLTGPKLQKDIMDVLLRFRLPRIVFTGDIKQMYRQILVNPEHRSYQCVYWRDSRDQPVKVYQLNTVTYGVSSAPYLALRTLHQLAEDEAAFFPNAAQVLRNDTYVDDVVSGANDFPSALQLRRDLQELLLRGGFELRKFSSNCAGLIEDLPPELRQQSSDGISFDEKQWIKVLGLRWNPVTDSFSYNWQLRQPIYTKRGILSEIARIFDPLGWLSPLILLAKLLIQHLWLAKVDWDAPAPVEITRKWEIIREELPCCAEIHLDRGLTIVSSSTFELHGFCDSSEKGYAAVIYLRRELHDGTITTHLLLAKSKVAPLKIISLPRLELCAAVLLARCLRFLLDSYKTILGQSGVYAWTDSTVVLSWLQRSPHVWKTFVANRVTKIQESTAAEWWHHVPGEQNPADCASRGLTPKQLVAHVLWWSGPPWLLKSKENWPPPLLVHEPVASVEQRDVVLHVAMDTSPLLELLDKHSCLKKSQRLTALCARFISNCRPGSVRRTGSIQLDEMTAALKILVRATQQVYLTETLTKVANNQACCPAIQRLSPFLDHEGLLRVGGRLNKSSLPFEEKHPLLLAKSCRLAELLIDQFHYKYLHAGSRTLQSLLQREFWIIGARNMIRQQLHKCMKCFRFRPKPITPTMASLPASRVCQAKPFLHTGVDYGGPIAITMARAKKPRVLQSYICLFICFTTKAIHLELSSDLSTDAFIAAFRRFVARRGHCAHLYSDCGTNFVGANQKLSKLQVFLTHPDTTKLIVDKMEDLKIQWHFNPPAAPHFGGLWEAGVKSVKSTLTKVVGSQLLTYEELYTVLTQIECALNSRPLCAVSSDPNDLTALTPSHFLTLGPAQALPEADVLDIATNRLTRWALLQQLHQSFWKRWHTEYLHQLQPRQKWTKNEANLEPGVLVLIKEPNLPPLRWRLGRVVKVFPGTDGVARVAEVRTQQGTFKRPVVKLCPLPSQ